MTIRTSTTISHHRLTNPSTHFLESIWALIIKNESQSTHIGDLTATTQIKSMDPAKSTHIGDITALTQIKP